MSFIHVVQTVIFKRYGGSELLRVAVCPPKRTVAPTARRYEVNMLLRVQEYYQASDQGFYDATSKGFTASAGATCDEGLSVA